MIASRTTAFTLMEALISISIMLTAVVAAMSLATQSIKTISVTRQRMVASMLARESMELVRNRRDQNFLEMLAYEEGRSGVSKKEKWLDIFVKPEDYGGDTPCTKSNGSSRPCVTQLDPTPESKIPEKFLTFGQCSGFGENDGRCAVYVLGEDELDSYDPTSPAAVPYLDLYRNGKQKAGSPKSRSGFERFVTIEQRRRDDDVAVIEAHVQWTDRFGTREYVLVDHLYNWTGALLGGHSGKQ